MGFSSKHLTVFSPETVNIKKLANLTANTKNYRQITLNTKPHSDPLKTSETGLGENLFLLNGNRRLSRARFSSSLWNWCLSWGKNTENRLK